MSARDDGGPAFPLPVTSEISAAASYRGMSLRDYFAGQAIVSCLPGEQVRLGDIRAYARWAYRMADAMLAERDEGGS